MNSQPKGLFWILPLIVLGAAGIIYFSLQLPQAPKEQAPDFTAKSLKGETVALSGLRGKPVYLYFGASWWGTCVKDAPGLERVWKKHKDKVNFVLIMTEDTEKNAKQFVKNSGITFPTIVDPGDIADRYKLVGHPMSYFIGPKGELLDSRIGGVTEEELDTEFNRLFF